MHKKVFLSYKFCDVCKKKFFWRKKWERDWSYVKYCSKRCRLNKKKSFA